MSLRVMSRAQEQMLDRLLRLCGRDVDLVSAIQRTRREMGRTPEIREIVRTILEMRWRNATQGQHATD